VTILALDTTSEFGSVAIRRGGKTLSEQTLQADDGFAHRIFAMIEAALKDAGVHLADIELFAAASGPGSFTGVRVGLAAVKGLAETMAKPAVGVSNLKALGSFGKLPIRAVILDARRHEIYCGVYSADLQPIQPESVMPLQSWLASLEDIEYELISNLGSDILLGTRFAAMPFLNPPKYLATAVAVCAEKSPALDPALLDANYVRRSDAELFWKDS